MYQDLDVKLQKWIEISMKKSTKNQQNQDKQKSQNKLEFSSQLSNNSNLSEC